MIRSQDQEIGSLVKDIHDGKLLLPELQRGYVWTAQQVRNLFDSLYHQYPSGQILVWETDELPASRSAGVEGVAQGPRRPQLLLDGQQRLTSLTAVMLGHPLIVRWRVKPIDIAFNLFTERFEVAGPRQRGQPGWIPLSSFFTKGAMAVLAELKLDDLTPEEKQQVYDRLIKLDNIKTYKYRVNVLEQLTYDEVTDIFVRINSGGTTLSSADLALAQVSSRWHGITQEFEKYIHHVQQTHKGLELDNGFLLRAILTLLTGQSRFAQFFKGERQQTTVIELQNTWRRVRTALDTAVNFVVQNCYIDRLDFLPTKSVLIPLVVFFDHFGKDISVTQERELQRWVYMALIWTRYSAASETALDQDITALHKEQPIQAMIQNIEDKVGRGRVVSERELQDQRAGSPYVLMAYVLARRAKAQDWFNGVVLGGEQQIEFHHIFPKAILRKKYDLRKDSRTVDQVANLAFLSRGANNRIGDRQPSEYLTSVDTQRLMSQSVPLNADLWTLERFEDFVRERRTMLADAINNLLVSLTGEASIWVVSDAEALETRINAVEEQLRDIITARLTAAQGEYAWEHLVPSDIRANVKIRIEQLAKKNPFEQDQYAVFNAKLEQCQFSDYPKIIAANWSLFQDVFGSQQRFDQHIRAVTDARNALKHRRSFPRYERALAEGGLLWLEEAIQAAILRDAAEDEEDELAG
jgi:hypothetical protein